MPTLPPNLKEAQQGSPSQLWSHLDGDSLAVSGFLTLWAVSSQSLCREVEDGAYL